MKTQNYTKISNAITIHVKAHTSLEFSHDGRRFVTVSADDTARAWDVDTGAEHMRMPYQQWSMSVAVSPDGELMASGGL